MAKIPWSRIRDAFDGEWIELVDCSWSGRASHPSAGHVRHHSASRVELLKMIARAGRREGAVVLFVGPALPSIVMHNEMPNITTWM
jgi:hypothetical protein